MLEEPLSARALSALLSTTRSAVRQIRLCQRVVTAAIRLIMFLGSYRTNCKWVSSMFHGWRYRPVGCCFGSLEFSHPNNVTGHRFLSNPTSPISRQVLISIFSQLLYVILSPILKVLFLLSILLVRVFSQYAWVAFANILSTNLPINHYIYVCTWWETLHAR